MTRKRKKRIERGEKKRGGVKVYESLEENARGGTKGEPMKKRHSINPTSVLTTNTSMIFCRR